MKTKLYGMQIKYACGHVEYGWSTRLTAQRVNKPCDLCSGKVARIIKAKKS